MATHQDTRQANTNVNRYQIPDKHLATGGTRINQRTEAAQTKKGFSYCQCIGKLIYEPTICRIDISTAIITLSQHSLSPAEIHYKAVKHLFV